MTTPSIPLFSESAKGSKDHITPLGFKNDGYDYSQHLREMGNWYMKFSPGIFNIYFRGGAIYRKRWEAP
jgi:hypothetical protein